MSARRKKKAEESKKKAKKFTALSGYNLLFITALNFFHLNQLHKKRSKFAKPNEVTLWNTSDVTYMLEISESEDGGLLKHKIFGQSSGKHTNFSYYFALK